MSLTKTRHRIYLDGALSARAFLCRKRTEMRVHGQCRPGALRDQLKQFSAHAFPLAFVNGFLDAMDAYVSMSLGGREVDPHTWEVLAALERRLVEA